MKKKEAGLKRPLAFNYYVDGTSLHKIADEMGIAYNTVRKWCEDFNWIKQKDDIDKELVEEQKQAIIAFKKKEIPLVMSLMNKTIRDIQITGKGTTKDFLMLYEKFEQLTKAATIFPADIEQEINKRFIEKIAAFREAMKKGIPFDEADVVTKDTDTKKKQIKQK